jgi:hypothetical protein
MNAFGPQLTQVIDMNCSHKTVGNRFIGDKKLAQAVTVARQIYNVQPLPLSALPNINI